MARRPNYGHEKRQKELQRQKKKEDKAEKQRLRKEAAASGAHDADIRDEEEGNVEENASDDAEDDPASQG